MRILDKNTDFYDYFQNVFRDNTFTFDRTDSFIVTKEIMCKHLCLPRWYPRLRSKDEKYHNFVLLQICNTFWLFLVEITKIDDFDNPKDYKIELVTTWHNYNKKRVLITLDIIDFKYSIRGNDLSKVHEKEDLLRQTVDMNDYMLRSRINKYNICYGDFTETEKHIPLLKACGIGNLIDPLDVYLAFEEYFSLEKTSSERRDPIGTTDKDKIESHGFDAKISFRGKQPR